MVRKLKASHPAKRRRRRGPYASLVEEPSPEERLNAFLSQARKRGLKPLAAEDLDAMGDAWPVDESIDEFLEWRRQNRREDRK
jgi:hypothetical protein